MKTDTTLNTETLQSKNISSAMDCNLTSEFWNEFSKSTWEQKTFVKRNNFVTPPISEEELFQCVVDMSARYLKKSDVTEVAQVGELRVFVAGTQITQDNSHLLPKESDENFSGYSKRMEEILDGKQFAFVIDGLAMPKNMKIWTRQFIKGMYRPLGTISHGHFWSIFFGNYTTTPFGVHVDSNLITAEGAFYFPLVGEKEMTTWKPSYVKENPDLNKSHDYSKHLEASTRLRAEAGGMLYWPSNRWHVGSSKGGDVSIVLGVKGFSDVYCDFIDLVMSSNMLSKYKPSGIRKWICPFFEFFLLLGHIKFLKHSNKARNNQVRNLPCDVDDLQGSAHEIPEGLKKIGRRLNLRLYFGKNIKKVISLFWLLHLTNLGVGSPNVPFPAIAYKPKLRIQKSEAVVLLWRQVDDKTIMFVADRYVHEISTQFISAVKAIADINLGQEFECDNLIDLMSVEGVSSQNVKQEVEDLLGFLGKSGAFEVSVDQNL